MEININENELNNKQLFLNRKLLFLFILLIDIIMISLFIKGMFLTQGIYTLFVLPILFIILVLIQVALFKTKNEKLLLFYFIVIILIGDSIIVYSGVVSACENDYFLYTRYLYVYIGLSIIILNSWLNLSTLLFIMIVSMKLIILTYILSYSSQKIYLLYDIFYFIFTLCISCLNNIIKSIYLKKFMNDFKNQRKLSQQYENIFNSIKIPILSINFENLHIFTNNTFLYLLNEIIHEKGYSEFFRISKCYNFEKITINPENNNYKLKENDKINESAGNHSLFFTKKLFILKDILSNFKNDETSTYFDLLELIHNDKHFNEDDEFDKLGSFTFEFDVPKLAANNNNFKLYWKKTIFSGKEKVIDIMLIDINSLRKLNIDNEENSTRNMNLAKVAHEFKTPINSLLYNIRNLKEILQGKNNEDILKEQIDIIEGEAKFITVLINDINDYCKEVKDLEVIIEETELKPILEFTYQVLNSLVKNNPLKKENIQVILNCADDLPTTINTDERRLKQLLVNLISNSCKFTNKGKISINVEYQASSHKFVFSIEDTGVGIPKDEIKNLFKDFSEINKKHKKMNKEGTGLGLSICKRVIDRFGGEIRCESDEKLTKFIFTIPVKDNKQCDNQFEFKEKLYFNKETENLTKEELIERESQDCSPQNINKRKNRFNSEEKFSNFIDTGRIKDHYFDKGQFELHINNLYLNSENDAIYNSSRGKSSIRKKSINENNLNPNEKLFIRVIENIDFPTVKSNFYYFLRPITKFMKLILKGENIILVLDDEVSTRKSLKNLIKSFYKERQIDVGVICINDAIEALYLIMIDSMFYSKIKLVFSDIIMNFMNGDMFVKIIQNLNTRNLNVSNIIIHSSFDSETLNDLKKCGVKYFIKKPCNKSDLKNVLK